MPDFDFSHMEITNTSIPLYLARVGITLQVVPAMTDSNQAMRDAKLRGIHKNIYKPSQITPTVIAQLRNEDRDLYAKHVIVGWSDVKDRAGNDVPWSKEACAELLQKLPNDIFDEVRNFCIDPDNFRAGSVAEVSKNS